MRFLSRLHGCAGAATLLVLYSFWHLNYADKNISSAWKSKRLRIVVFGDDWSDTGHYRVSPPPHVSVAARDPDRGDIWVETLCEELMCDIHNFARSIAPDIETASVGSVVDLDAFSQATTDSSTYATVTTLDFKAQVQQFLAYEKGSQYFSRGLRRIDEKTIFTVYYGLWDLLEYSMLSKDQAMRAIDDSIAGLFQELDLLSEKAAHPIRVILPRMIDVSFLPWFQSRRENTQGQFAMAQHHMIFLWTYWNNLLVHTAIGWTNGEIFMPDSNAVIMEQVRAKQLHAAPLSNASKQAPLFEYIEQPCLVSKLASDSTVLDSPVTQKCFDPAQHLFWDDLHLSGTAHQLIGLHAASLVLSNASVNTHPAPLGFTPIGKRPATGFNLRFPPGY